MSKRELKLITLVLKMIYAPIVNHGLREKFNMEVEEFFHKNYGGKFLKYLYNSEDFDKLLSKTVTSIKG